MKTCIVPCAGLGSRFYPFSLFCPKELAPIGPYPVLYFIVKEAVECGFEQIVVVTSRRKHLIETFFSFDYEKETLPKKEEITNIKNILNKIEISFVYQEDPKGLGDAILLAEDSLKIKESGYVYIMLPDFITACNMKYHFQKMKSIVLNTSASGCLMVTPVKSSEIESYGVISFKENKDGISVLDAVEKPNKEDAPSNLAIVGRYLLSNKILKNLRTIRPGRGGEVQLTDAFRGVKNLRAYIFKDKYFDTGTPSGLYEANSWFFSGKDDI